MSKVRLEAVKVKQLMSRVKEERMPFNWSVNPYRGCSHGCGFCYARAFQSFIGLDSDEFQNRILVKENAAEALQQQLHRMAASREFDLPLLAQDIGHIAVGTATDPYQPAESSRMVTRECLKVMARYQVPVSITTRSPLVLRDLDLLAQCRLIAVNISLNTLDDGLIRSLEPGSPLSGQRLQAVRELREAGMPAGVFAAPILPVLGDSRQQLNELMQAVKSAGAEYMMTSLLRLSPEVKSWYYRVVRETAPQVLPEYERIFHGAYASSSYADKIHRRIEELRVIHDLPSSETIHRKTASHSPERSAELAANPGSLQSRLAKRRDNYEAAVRPGPAIEIMEQLSFSF
ncbi:radical SAM protein [Paenibacillus pasadenensis]|uniref:SPL family radical SAM protein n=1 Tax=Paenibacillus pasadenensis TaxID=217090 RepID=UPI00203E376B|nr:radical SAM protein [Paenibacillus pasadenensis]MCM3748405.1 radical SAM protein [Paenibacillus pasadenensis]